MDISLKYILQTKKDYQLIKLLYPTFTVLTLFIASCSIPSRFVNSEPIIPAGMVGSDFGFGIHQSRDTSTQKNVALSIAAIQKLNDDFSLSFGFTYISPFLGAEYTLFKTSHFSSKIGLNFGLIDVALSIPFKSHVIISDQIAISFAFRYARILYKRDYEKINSKESFFAIENSMYSPQYVGVDLGFDYSIKNEMKIGVRAGIFLYKNPLENRDERFLLLSVNTFIPETKKTFSRIY